MCIVTVNREDILRYVLRELGFMGSACKSKVFDKYDKMSKRDFNKLVYSIFKDYNMYFKPNIKDRVLLVKSGDNYVACYTFYDNYCNNYVGNISIDL